MKMYDFSLFQGRRVLKKLIRKKNLKKTERGIMKRKETETKTGTERETGTESETGTRPASVRGGESATATAARPRPAVGRQGPRLPPRPLPLTPNPHSLRNKKKGSVSIETRTLKAM